MASASRHPAPAPEMGTRGDQNLTDDPGTTGLHEQSSSTSPRAWQRARGYRAPGASLGDASRKLGTKHELIDPSRIARRRFPGAGRSAVPLAAARRPHPAQRRPRHRTARALLDGTHMAADRPLGMVGGQGAARAGTDSRTAAPAFRRPRPPPARDPVADPGGGRRAADHAPADPAVRARGDRPAGRGAAIPRGARPHGATARRDAALGDHHRRRLRLGIHRLRDASRPRAAVGGRGRGDAVTRLWRLVVRVRRPARLRRTAARLALARDPARRDAQGHREARPRHRADASRPRRRSRLRGALPRPRSASWRSCPRW